MRYLASRVSKTPDGAWSTKIRDLKTLEAVQVSLEHHRDMLTGRVTLAMQKMLEFFPDIEVVSKLKDGMGVEDREKATLPRRSAWIIGRR